MSAKDMSILIVGLGNPGKKFKFTRHNAGFLAVDFLQKKWGFPEFKERKKYLVEISKGEFKGAKIILAKPLTFMNSSGQAIKLIAKSYKLLPKASSLVEANKLFVIHDDSDLALGKIKISCGAGSGGHKGVESIIQELKTKDFYRIRVGIRPEGNKEKAENFVLKNFSRQERQKLQGVLEQTYHLIKKTVLGRINTVSDPP